MSPSWGLAAAYLLGLGMLSRGAYLACLDALDASALKAAGWTLPGVVLATTAAWRMNNAGLLVLVLLVLVLCWRVSAARREAALRRRR